MGAKYVVYTFEFKVEQLNKFHSVKPPNDKGILCLLWSTAFWNSRFSNYINIKPRKKEIRFV